MSIAQTATLAHGYTMDDLNRATGTAVRQSRGGRALDYVTPNHRWDCAWFGVVEHLYASEGPPEFFDLVDAGRRAIRAAAEDDARERGVLKSNRPNPGRRYSLRSGHMKYWINDNRTKSADFTERTVERLALPQVLALLSEIEYEAIAAMAVHGTQSAAAAALGLGHSAFETRLYRARERILRAWLEGETPWSLRNVDLNYECRAGHLRTEHGFRLNGDGPWRCRACIRNAGRRRKARGDKITKRSEA
ncbi:hypothetical protein [Nocardioides sp.]|uniref:hypothetical protein n=1 Tax=Nocardioides sp. TaxID=35761 RepID=UPI002608C0C5|nr:hypothetical protein [Nocardioides sp.]MDI6908633.1 hypothetical protein [Nocardioides sp.]